MTTVLRVDNPATGEVACELPYVELPELERCIERSVAAQRAWAQTPLEERQRVVLAFAAAVEAATEEVAQALTAQMGKPITQARGEVRTMAARARRLVELAPQALAPRTPPALDGFTRSVRRLPVGVVVDVAPWNYPLLTTINALAAAVLAGNSFLLKPSPRTPLTGEQMARLFARAGGPADLVQSVLVDHWTAARLLQHPAVGFVAFTGSVRGGHEVYRTVAEARFAEVGLELGGKDAAYVAPDADLGFTIPNVVEGALYNAGQSCCAVERVYVASAVYDRFVEGAIAAVADWQPGDPTDNATALGPMALPTAPAALAAQVAEAKSRGASVLTGGGPTAIRGVGRYFAPTLLVDVTDDMLVMREESFGPVLGIARVDSEDEAIRRINDSHYGLTASIWSTDAERVQRLAPSLEVGTVFMNRCDYLDPDLPWTGCKDSGRGATLGVEGFAAFTRLQSWHFRTRIPR